MPFDAFISYSHAADDALAPAVQRGLQTLARPWNRRRALEIFRDQTGLAVSPGLWSSICAGLDESRHFVLLASPEAAASTWVNQEIVRWARSHSIDQLLPVLTAGEWVWDAGRGDFDWDRSNAVPPALGGMFVEEPLYLDLRWARTEAELDLRHSRFREAIAQLAAPMHGVSPEDLESSDVARYRRVVRLRRTVVATLCVLLALVSVAGVLAVRNAREAQQQQREARAQQVLAEQQARRALSLQLLAQAKVVPIQRKTLGLLLTAEAARLAPTEAWGPLVTALADTAGLITVFDLPAKTTTGSPASAVDVEAKILASVPRKASIQPAIELRSLATGRPVGPTDPVTGEVGQLRDSDFYGFELDQLMFSPDGALAAVYRCESSLCATAGARTGSSATSRDSLGGIQVVNIETGDGKLLPDSAGSAHLTFSHDGNLLAASGADGAVRVWDLATGAITTRIKSRLERKPTALAFSADDAMLALSERNKGRILVWHLEGRNPSRPVDISVPGHSYAQEIAFGSDFLASRDNSGRVHLWSADSGTSVGRLASGSRPVVSMCFAVDGTLATASKDGSLRLWDVNRHEQMGSARQGGVRGGGGQVMFDRQGALVSIGTDVRYWDTSAWGQVGRELYHQPPVTALAVSQQGVVASGDEHGVIRLWDLNAGWPRSRPLRSGQGAVTALAFSSRGMLASGGEDGAVRLWDIAAGREARTPLENHDGTVASLAFDPDGAMLAAGYTKGQHPSWHRRRPILVWQVGTGSVLQRLDVGRAGGVGSVAFASNGVFASAGSDSLAVWDVTTWQSSLLDNSRSGPYTSVTFTPDGQELAASAEGIRAHPDKTVALWSARTHDPLGTPLVAGASHSKSAFFRSLAFAPDGNLLAGAGPGGVQLWNVLDRQPLGGRLGTASAVSVAVSFDGSQVVAGDSAGSVRSYPATVEGWLRVVCAVVSRNLTAREWESFVGSAASYEKTCPQYPGG